MDNFLKVKINNKTDKCNVLVLDDNSAPDEDTYDGGFSGSDTKLYSHTVLGGTFDRLHIAHKVLLSEAALRSYKIVTVGVTEEGMLKGM